ncbi:HAD family hydrolase [Streptomyces capparidis]
MHTLPAEGHTFDDLLCEGVLFDNDGTLIDSLGAVARCWTRWAEEYRVTPERFAAVELHGRPAAEIVADLLPASRVPEAVRRIEELELADTEGVRALPGAAELVASLPADRWAVVTSATRALAERRLAAVGIHPPLIVAADDVTRGKPDPEPFLLAAGKLGVAPGRCVVFEDAPVGLAAARAAGMTGVAVVTTHRREELAADAVLDGLHQVRALPGAGGVRLALGG